MKTPTTVPDTVHLTAAARALVGAIERHTGAIDAQSSDATTDALWSATTAGGVTGALNVWAALVGLPTDQALRLAFSLTHPDNTGRSVTAAVAPF